MNTFPPSKEENVPAWCVFPLQDMPEMVKKKVTVALSYFASFSPTSDTFVHFKLAMGLVSEDTVVLSRWESETQNFGFYN